MDLKEYQEICKKTAKKFDNKDLEISTWGLGVSGEAGDIANCIKKTFIHKKDVKEGIRENIGDTLWYIAMICNFMGWNLEEILQENMKKLSERFPKGFSDEAVQRDRVDWGEK